MEMDRLAIVPMTQHHWPAVRAIWADGIATGEATFETEPPTWERFDAGHPPAGRIVALAGPVVAGWAALAPVSARAAYSGVAEVSVYVASDQRRRGVGRSLLRDLVERATNAGYWTLQASVFPENAGTLALHAAAGFRLVGRRERIARQAGRWRDTYLLERREGRQEPAPIVLPAGGGRRYAMGAIEAVFKVDEHETGAAYSVSEWWLDPLTAGPGAHRHALNDELFVGLAGTMSLRVGDAWHALAPGAFARIPAGVVHDFENRGAERAGVLNVFLPGGFERSMPAIAEWFRANPPGPAGAAPAR
jgi:L-amino acid N-acyltransferase YncA/quercetin dioxygenase-like cupin family protein